MQGGERKTEGRLVPALAGLADDIHEMCMQLLPEPTARGGQDGDVYFRDGSRTFISFAAQSCVLVDGEQASLGDVAQMLNDRNELLKHALWACGKLLQGEDETGEKIFATMPLEASPWVEWHDPQDVANYVAYYRGLASGVADLLLTEKSRTADSFITGAQQALARFNISTRAHRKTKGATFRFADRVASPLDPELCGLARPPALYPLRLSRRARDRCDQLRAGLPADCLD